MRAYLYDDKGMGSEHSTVTRNYKSFGTMLRYAIIPFAKTHDKYCKAEIYYNWDNRYGKPDRIYIWK
jgi:hypothetical protein